MTEQNPFDDLGFSDLEEAKKQVQQEHLQGQQLDYLIHRTFKQNDAGVSLLSMWTDALLLKPTAGPGDDMLTVGINEGIKQFIRNIILTIEKVEKEGQEG